MMVSNQLSGRPFFPRPPTVCIGKPDTPSPTLSLYIYIKPDKVRVYQDAILYIDAFNPIWPIGSRYSAAWNPGAGSINPYPEPLNAKKMEGVWIAPGAPCYTWITVVVTWPDDKSAFASVRVEVLPY